MQLFRKVVTSLLPGLMELNSYTLQLDFSIFNLPQFYTKGLIPNTVHVIVCIFYVLFSGHKLSNQFCMKAFVLYVSTFTFTAVIIQMFCLILFHQNVLSELLFCWNLQQLDPELAWLSALNNYRFMIVTMNISQVSGQHTSLNQWFQRQLVKPLVCIHLHARLQLCEGENYSRTTSTVTWPQPD